MKKEIRIFSYINEVMIKRVEEKIKFKVYDLACNRHSNQSVIIPDKLNLEYEKNIKRIKDLDDGIKCFLKTISRDLNSVNKCNINHNLEYLKIYDDFFHSNFYRIYTGHNGLYIGSKNAIVITKDDYQILFHELFHLSSTFRDNENIYSGFCYQTPNAEIGRGFNEWYTSLLCHSYFPVDGNKSQDSYHIERVAAQVIDCILDGIEDFYFSSDLNGLVTTLEQFDTRDNIIKFLKNLDYITSVIKYRKKANDLLTEDISHQIYETLMAWYTKSLDKQQMNKEKYNSSIAATEKFIRDNMNRYINNFDTEKTK